MTKKVYTIFGIILGLIVVLFGLLSKTDLDDNFIVANDNTLKLFYLANRNLEEPVFIKYEDLSETQISLIKKDYIKREVLKREALSWGLDKVDPVISSRLSQLGEQFLINNLSEEEISEKDLLSFYNKNKFFYIEDEKINIANKFLLPKQIKDNGVKEKEMKLGDNIIKEIIRSYTKESGVRNLEREISKVARKVVKKVVAGEEKEVNIDTKNLSDFLGVPKFKFGELESENRVGIVTGLAWTEYGGEILKIETVTMPGKGRMQITGKLGDVMQESVKAAKSFVRSKCLEYGIIPPLFEKKDFHIHVPEGATPKDGPSAGIGMVTSIVSSITNIPVRRDLAMTGEVTITGQVLPIGGLKEKLLAAHRAGIKEVLIPKENEKDLVDMPKKIIDEVKITPVEFADEVLKIALTKELKKTEWVEVDLSKKDDKSQASIQ